MDINDIEFINTTFNSLTIILSTFMIGFNLLILYLVFSKFSEKTTELKFIILLCFLEIETGASKGFLAIMKLIYGYDWLSTGTPQCYFYGFELHWVLRFEINTVMILAVMRYFIVCRKKEFSWKFCLACLVLISLPMTAVFIYGSATSDSKHIPTHLTCQPFIKPDQASIILGASVPFFFAIPCWIITYCYFAVGYTVNKQLNQMKSEAKQNQDTNLLNAITKQKILMVVQLTFVIIVYNVNFMLSYMTAILKFAIGYKRTPFVEAWTFFLVFFSIGLNPVMTIAFQPELKAELGALMFRIRLKVKKSLLCLF